MWNASPLSFLGRCRFWAAVVSGEDAGAVHVLAGLDRRAVVVDGASGGDVRRCERHAEIEVECAAVRRDPRKGPFHKAPDLLDPLERHARDRGECQVGMLEMLTRRIDMIRDAGTSFAEVVRPRRQHELINGEFAVAAEQICERHLPWGPSNT